MRRRPSSIVAAFFAAGAGRDTDSFGASQAARKDVGADSAPSYNTREGISVPLANAITGTRSRNVRNREIIAFSVAYVNISLS